MRCPSSLRIAVAWSFLALGADAGAQATPAGAPPCDSCGVVVAIRMSVQEEEWTPLGVVSPASSLAAPGGTEARSAFAFGSEGNRGLVLIGAAGGAMYAKRPTAYQRPRWDVTVKMDRGDTRTLQQRYEPLLREGDRVRVLGTQVELADS
jgi:outer membrane lipoprotein SlyB